MEHFALGDKYDVVQDGSSILTVTVTTLIGFESDEGVGDDSFIGALATLETEKQDWLMYYTPGYLGVQRHRELSGGTGKDQERIRTVFACLLNEPVRFDIQSKIVELLNGRMKSMATDAQRHEAESVSPLFAVLQFRLTDGTLRDYAKAAWKSGKEPREKSIYSLGGGLLLGPHSTSWPWNLGPASSVFPICSTSLTSPGATRGFIVSEHGNDSVSLSLVECRDGMHLGQMRTLQSIGSGE